MTDRFAKLRKDWPAGAPFSTALVSRAIDATFASGMRDRVRAAIDLYDPDGNDRGRSRVQLAIVHLSRGDPQRIHDLVDEAEQDYRDVLARAEYAPPTAPLVAEVRLEYLRWLDALSARDSQIDQAVE